MSFDELMMTEAIKLANKGLTAGEAPIGAVVVQNNKIIGSAHTSLQSMPDPTAHAEVLALRMAANAVGSRYLERATLYTTLEPCPMCTAAAIWAKCERIVYGATQDDALLANELNTSGVSLRQIRIRSRFVAEHGTPKLEITEGVLRDECLHLIGLPKRDRTT